MQAVTVRPLEDARDRELARHVASGDERAFRLLFRRYGPIAKALAVRIVRQPFLAEEIVQEAFLALWRRPDAYREDRGSFRSWLMSTVHHRAVDLVRREEAHRRRAAESELDATLSGIQEDVAQRVVDEAETVRARARVRMALAELPSEQRDVLELMYFGGKSQSTIAQELELPLGTVKSRSLLGMRRLRSLLTEVGRSVRPGGEA
ncbi:MAG: RNA polymerase sigma factor [Actinomycetota bacterium]